MDNTIINRLCEQGKLELLAGLKNGYRVATQQVLHELLVNPEKNCHKGHFGHVVVFEGQPQYLGASRLAARAALRVGAGLITLAVDNNINPTSLDLPEFMRIKASDIDDTFFNKISALVIGPGLGRIRSQQEAALTFLNRLRGTPLIVCDADALPLLNHKDLTLTAKTIIATPHAKEAADLLGTTPDAVEHDPYAALEKLSSLPCNQKNHLIWLLKGANSLIRAQDGTIFAFKGELPLLSAGGMGDVLSGAIAGLSKQTDCGLCAVVLAVSLQIASASLLSKSAFKGILASELADMFPRLTKRS